MSNPLTYLGHLPSFHAVMAHGSLSAAARALHLAQPTVRRHIEALEVALSAQLFTRAANGLTPTAMADTLWPLTQSVMDQATALARAASAEQGALEGTVRLTTSRIVACHILPRVLRDLRMKAPNLRLEVAATDSAENLAQRAADIAIRFTEPTQQALIALRLPDVAVGLFAADGVSLPKTPEDVADAPFIADDRENLLLPAMTDFGLPTPTNVVMRCDDPLAQTAYLQAGLGIGFCQVKLGRRLGLVRALPQITYQMPAWLVMHEDQSKIARLRFVFDHLKVALPALM